MIKFFQNFASFRVKNAIFLLIFSAKIFKKSQHRSLAREKFLFGHTLVADDDVSNPRIGIAVIRSNEIRKNSFKARQRGAGGGGEVEVEGVL
jgi:hypothetical protein